MINDELIAALEGRRDAFSQRQRAADGLLKAFKGATGALAKTNRALDDYAVGATTLEPAKLTCTQEAFAGLSLKEEAIDPLLPDLRREEKALKDVVAALREAIASLQGETVDVVKLDRALKTLRATMVRDEATDELMPELERELRQAQLVLGETFGVALRHALAALGIEVQGRPPRFDIGCFEVEADFSSRAASISFGKIPVAARVPLSVEATVKAYQREQKAVMGRGENTTRWMEQLHAAWEIARLRRGQASKRANIVDCYYEMVLQRQSRAFKVAPSKHTFADYSRAQFAHDLQDLAVRRQLDYKGKRVIVHVAAKSQAEGSEKSMWIVEGDSPHLGQYMGDIEFS